MSEPAIDRLELELVKPSRRAPSRVMRVGIPTNYQGTLFRSRTEARWAAFFNELGWRWTYEPFDLNGYIPDFSLHFDAGELLVEVKSTDEDFAGAERKLWRSGYDGHVLIVGHDVDRNVCGRITDDGTGLREFADAEFFYCTACERPSVLASEGSWKCRQCGATEHHVAPFDVTEEWARAANFTQWRKS